MKKRNILKTGFIALATAFVLQSCETKPVEITVNPVSSNETLLNPGRGFTTTASFHNSTIDEKKRIHPKSGVHQVRYYWDSIEPVEGKIRFDIIDADLKAAVDEGEQFNFRIMCQHVDMRIPQWAIDAGIKGPDYYNDPVFLEKQANIVKALGERYDGHPNLSFMDLGTVGQWAEWHSEEKPEIVMPTEENARKIVDFYFDSFKKTPIVMLINGGKALEYAVSKGAGWRADCWGDYGDNWKHMEVRYPEAFKASPNSVEAWKNAPVALESCWTISYWHEEGWDIDKATAAALEWHTTSVNTGNQSVPEEWWPQIQEFEKKLGYRYELKAFTYTNAAKAGQDFAYTAKWENVGVAPIYLGSPVSLKLVSKTDASNSVVINTPEDITTWFPGESISNASVKLPETLTAGTYELYIGITESNSDKPFIKLAIEGAVDGGWYKMGDLNIVK